MKNSIPLRLVHFFRRLLALALAFGTGAAVAQAGPDIGSAQVWGVNASGTIYRMVSNQGWQPVAGALKQVSVGGDGTVWGVNSGNEIYRMVSNQWQKVPGALTQVSVGNAQTVWGVNAAGEIWRLGSNLTWQQVPGNLKHVSVAGDGAVWGVNSSGAIYQMVSNQWKQVPGVLTQIAVGNAQTVWGVNAAGNIWRLKPDQTWQQMPGLLKNVSVSGDGTVWGVNAGNEIYRMVSNQWQKVSGSLVQVSVGSVAAPAPVPAPAPAPAPAPVAPAPAPADCTPPAPTGFVIGHVPDVCGVKFSWNPIPSIPECGAVSYYINITENGSPAGLYNAGDRTATPFPTPKGVALTYSVAARRGDSHIGAATAPVAFKCTRDRVYWYPDPNKANHAACIAGTVPCGRYLDMCMDARMENGVLLARCIDMAINQFVNASLPMPCAGMVDRVMIDNRTNGKMYCLVQ